MELTEQFAPGLSERIALIISDRLRALSEESIVGPDAYGAFPASKSYALFPAQPLVIVADTNGLFPHVKAASKTQRRTILSTAANVGAIRLYCAQHVIDELYEHSDTFAARSGVTETAFIAAFEENFLPLLRCIDVTGMEALLTDSERSKLASLQLKYPDDVPSATLALAINGLYLTKDRDAFEAVYGRELRREESDFHTELLKPAGEALARNEMLYALALIPAIGWSAITELLKIVPKPLRILAAVAGCVALVNLVRHHGNALRGSALLSLGLLMDLYTAMQEAHDELASRGPGEPTWETLHQDLEQRKTVTRAMLHTLARAPACALSARRLAPTLPQLAIPQGEAIIRAILRSQPFFVETRRGCFQLGAPAQVPTEARSLPT